MLMGNSLNLGLKELILSSFINNNTIFRILLIILIIFYIKLGILISHSKVLQQTITFSEIKEYLNKLKYLRNK